MDDNMNATPTPQPVQDNKAAPVIVPPLTLNILLSGPGIQIASSVTITDVQLKDLLSYPNLHMDLVKAAQVGACMLCQSYAGSTPSPVAELLDKKAA